MDVWGQLLEHGHFPEGDRSSAIKAPRVGRGCFVSTPLFSYAGVLIFLILYLSYADIHAAVSSRAQWLCRTQETLLCSVFHSL